MSPWIPFLPEDASTLASEVDRFFFFLVGLSLFFILLIAGLEVYFAIKYRRRSPDEIPRPVRGMVRLEVIWIVIPFALSMVIFAWGAVLYHRIHDAPPGSMDIFVTGKQWMWRIQHMNGTREINELHIPVGRPVRLVMTSEDVIHDFFVPAFRVKADVIPGRYTYLWFEAKKPGRYHLFCAEYCGTDHAKMGGWVYAMEPDQFQTWLGGGATTSLASSGEKLFTQLACNTCHRQHDEPARGPTLEGLYGTEVLLSGGQRIVADESYLRESILSSQSKIVSGFEKPVIMPTYQGQISEDQLLQLISYIKSIGPEPASGAVSTGNP